MQTWRQLSSQAGFTLIEVMVAMTMMLTGTVFAVSLIDRANDTTRTTAARDAATSLTRELTESIRAVPYESLNTGTLLQRLSAQPGLEDTVPGGAYTLTRRNRQYTITGSVCVVDDPRDGGGDQSAGGYCPGSAALSSPPDQLPQDYKRAYITTTWADGNRQKSLTQSVVLNNPGAAEAPSVRSIAPMNTSTTVTSSTNPIRLQFTTNRPAATLNWTVDGDIRAPAASPNAARDIWTVDWDVSKLPDGVYSVGAEAFDAQGLAGSTLQVSVSLNRNLPAAPTAFSGGRNAIAGGVELEWAANVERDIVGYEVRRGTTVVCSLASTQLNTECRDLAPPAPRPSGERASVIYTVYAYDRDPVTGAARASAGTNASIIDYNEAPDMPAQFARGTGGTTLQWNRAQDGKPSGDVVAFYRIYRDGIAYADRYLRWYDNASTALISWTETRPDGASHTYRVTAVDMNFAESTMTAPVVVP